MGRKLTVFMLDGTATGPKTIDIGNWSGRSLFSPRSSLKGLLGREELQSPGIYILQSEAEESRYDSSIYIGEAEQLSTRLRQHLADRDFESAICFSSRDEGFTKAHIKFLEAKLIQISRDAGTCQIENGTTPKGARLSEADTSDMNYFVEQIRLILPLVGIRALVEAAPHAPASLRAEPSDAPTFKIRSKELSATLVETSSGFIVRAGSEASLETSKSIAVGWLNLRKKLLDQGLMKAKGNRYIFTEDTTFSSPSAASSVVLGRQAAGPISWVLPDGRTYKEAQEQ